MKLSHRIWILALFLSLLASFASAQALYFPLPLNGKVVNENADNQLIEVKNVRSGAVQLTYTSSEGEFLVDAANFDIEPRYLYQDSFKITLMPCASDSKCVKTFTWTGQSSSFFQFNVEDVSLISPEDTPEYWVNALIVAGGGFFVGLFIYWWRKDPERAKKMARTFISNRKK